MKGYKAFEKGMICRGKQYAENTVFEEENAEICKSGIHFVSEDCPLEVLNYYDLVDENGNEAEFAEVEALDDPVTNDNKKFCSKKLKIGGKVSFADLVKAEIEICAEKAKNHQSGDGAKIGSSGKNSVICCAGHNCKAKSKKRSWITLAEWDYSGNEPVPICVKTEQVDGERIKEDVFYVLKNGEFQEVTEE